MSWLQFIADLVGVLAWPVLVSVGLVIFRKPITALAQGMAAGRSLKRVKAGPIEAEWEQQLDQTEQAMVGAAQLQNERPDSDTAEDPHTEELLALASKSPTGALLKAFQLLEIELSRVAEESGVLKDSKRRSTPQLSRLLHADGRIDDETMTSVRSVSEVRNQVVHEDADITPARAAQYVLVAMELRSRVGRISGR
ncbi:hypothetical protein [Actinopolyspora xinjiangensis]|nr:hypothetical protein [Actinopolyspora xinjiangensis]